MALAIMIGLGGERNRARNDRIEFPTLSCTSRDAIIGSPKVQSLVRTFLGKRLLNSKSTPPICSSSSILFNSMVVVNRT